MIYLADTSALAKRYLNEKGSPYIRRLFQAADAVVCQTFLTPLELTSALYRRHRAGHLAPAELSTLLRAYAAHSNEAYLLVPYSDSLIDVAGQLIARHPLRALDAIQLAGALQLRDCLPSDAPSLTFLAADDTLVTAARREHLGADNPEDWP